jgi:UPF0288 family protein (methanogenesis marker protein 3)
MYYLRTQAARDAIKFTVKKIGEVPIEMKEEGDTSPAVKFKNENPKSIEVEKEDKTKYGGFTKKEMLEKMSSVDDDDPNMCISCGA